MIGAAALCLGSAATAEAMTAVEMKARVDHHLREAATLVAHFETVVTADCPRFPDAEAWNHYVDGEADRLALLAAHVEQAWVEAKRHPDDDVRRAAKAPRRQKEQARQLVDKLSSCAALNGASFSPLLVWQRVERDVPRRRAEIALPR
jgi:hypothetical protein